MSDRSDQELPQDLAEVGELLRENRATASALELDQIKLQARTRAHRRHGSPQLRRGVNVRSRGVTLILTLLLLGGTTAGGMAWGGGGNDNGDGAAQAQYRPPKCTKDMRKCECPNGYSLQVQNGQIVCGRNPDGGHGNGGGEGHGGHGHHHHNHWRQGHDGHWQCSDDGNHWRDWNGRDDDW
ncbi:MAG: hypothetical protein QOI19_3004 [Thermoleophilaceae bacterium]|jgi:hypothetical protein|nr:hypothetical protein [Thermoleophilaceae bacterium]